MRAVAHLATRPDHMSTIPEMSEAIRVNAPYLRKVLNRLRDNGIVESHRGTGGGIYLAFDPDDLTLLDVLNAIDPLRRIETCPLGLPDHLKLCPLHSELDAAISKIEQVLGARSIGELLSTRRSAGRCGFPRMEELFQL